MGKPKSVKDKKTSIEVKNVEENENTIPIVTDETRKIHISVEPWNKIEEIAPLEVLDKDKIETAEDYIVDEPVTPELAPGVTVQDNQTKNPQRSKILFKKKMLLNQLVG